MWPQRTGPKAMIQMGAGQELGGKLAHQAQGGALAAGCTLAIVCSSCPGLHPLESSGKGHVSALGMEREPLWPSQQALRVALGQRSFHRQCWRFVLFMEAGWSPGPSTALPLQPPRAQWRRPPQYGPCECAAQRCGCWPKACAFPTDCSVRGPPAGRPGSSSQGSPSLEHLCRQSSGRPGGPKLGLATPERGIRP